MDLAGRTAIVTGGASGIGRATALALGRAGSRLIVADRDEAGAGKTVALLRSRGGTGEAIRCDVTRAEQIGAAIAAAERLYGGLDILFNNAGIATGLPAFPATDPARWRQTLAVNLHAVILATQLAIPAMRRRGGGSIVNTSSTAGITGADIDPVYAASKAGVLIFTRSLAGLLEQENIRVNCICPGVTDTPFVRAAEDPRMAEMPGRFPVLQPEEIAEAVIGLLQDDTAAGRALLVSASRPRTYWEPL
ncbi:MAG: SDR family NAD(P)-dependent oxidoreductase [Dehalococcoidia bacterium]